MSVVSRVLGTAAAMAVVGVGVAALGKLLKKQQEKLDAERMDTEQDALDQAAEALDEEELADAASLDADAAQAENVRRAAEAEEKPPVEPLAGYTPKPDSGPNANPVLSGPSEAPRRADGSVDAEKLCSPEDFGDWEDLGCQG
jgi:hypothetical protein